VVVNFRYKKNEHQKEFHDDLVSKFLHLNSGYGGGKTYGLIMKLFQLSWLNRPFPGGLVVPDIQDYKKDVLPMMEEILDEHNLYSRSHYHKTDKTWRFPWSPGKLYVASAEKKIRGPNWAYAGFNEVTLIPWARYKEGVGRVRIKRSRYPQIVSSGTPEGTSSEIYENFVLNPMARSRIIYGDTRNNAMNLADDYIQQLMDSYDQIALSAYLKGMFINMSGAQFYYALDPLNNYSRQIKEDPNEPVLVSLDFNVDPFTATIWQRRWDTEKKQSWYAAVSEIVLHGAQTKDMANALKARGYVPERTTIYPDPAGKARSTSGNPDIVILGHEGFKQIKYRNVAPDFRRRQLCVNNLLEKSRIILNPDTCPSLKRDFEAVEQDKVDYSKIKKNPKLTHSSDGADYMFDIEEPLSGTKPTIEQVRIR
jgi:hypothetical protein